jgi:signal transduction histidine kinase
MNPGKYVAMDATISLHSFGRRNNWFSDRLRQLSISNLKPILLLLGVMVFGSFSTFAASYHQSMQPVGESLEYLSTINTLVQQIGNARLNAEHFLAANTPATYDASERAVIRAVDAIERIMQTAQPVEYFMLSRLEQTTTDYLNTFRSLGSLTFDGAPADTRQTIRERLNSIAILLDQQADEALQTSMADTDAMLQASSAAVTRTAVILLGLIVLVFGVSLAFVIAITRHSAYALHQIGQAAQRITMEQYDTRIDLSGETNPDIIHLGMAFNRMAENLRQALRSESAAQKQNRLQLMKLAREERKTAVLEERQRIARELHDSVKQQLFSLTLSAGAAINLLEHAPERVHTHLEHIQQAGHNAQAEMTTLLQELIPASMQDKRLEDALLGYLNPLCEVHGLKLLWRVDGTNLLTIAQEHALFRAVQEAASNVVRHSGATVLHISVNFGLVTHVIVEDNGEGFVPEAIPATSSGLSMMRARLMRVGGSYELQTTPGMGTRLTILLDLRRATLPRGKMLV